MITPRFDLALIFMCDEFALNSTPFRKISQKSVEFSTLTRPNSKNLGAKAI